MRNINLLPPKQRQKHLALSLVTYLTVGFVILLITLGGFVVTLTTIQVTINDKISTYDTQTATIQHRINAFKSLETDLSNTNKSLQLANSALAMQLHPNDVLEAITTKTGPTVILTAATIAPPPAAAVTKTSANQSPLQLVTLTGSANDRASIIQFKRGLESDHRFSNVIYAIGDNSAGSTAGTDLTFTISMNLDKSSGSTK